MHFVHPIQAGSSIHATIGTVIVKAVSGGVYGEVARFEGVEFLWRKGNLDSGYLLADGTPMEVAKAKGCGCG